MRAWNPIRWAAREFPVHTAFSYLILSSSFLKFPFGSSPHLLVLWKIIDLVFDLFEYSKYGYFQVYV